MKKICQRVNYLYIYQAQRINEEIQPKPEFVWQLLQSIIPAEFVRIGKQPYAGNYLDDKLNITIDGDDLNIVNDLMNIPVIMQLTFSDNSQMIWGNIANPVRCTASIKNGTTELEFYRNSIFTT